MRKCFALSVSIHQKEHVMRASDSFAIILILIALSYAVNMFVAN